MPTTEFRHAAPFPDERIGAVSFADPWRRLERDDVAVRSWQQRENERTDAALAGVAGLQPLRDQLTRQALDNRLVAPLRHGDGWLWLERDASGCGRAITRSDRLVGTRTTLVSATDLPLDGDETIDWFAPSPDGSLLAVGVSGHGDEQSVLTLVSAHDGRPTGVRLRHAGGAAVRWLSDSRALLVCAGRGPDAASCVKRLVQLDRDGGLRELDAPPHAEVFLPTLCLSADDRWVALSSLGHMPRVVAVLDRQRDLWLDGAGRDGEIFHGAFDGDRYLAVTTRGAPRGRLVAASPEALDDEARWTTLVPESTAVLRTVVPSAGELLLLELADGMPRLRLADLDGRPRATVPLPPQLVVSAVDRDRNQLSAQMPATATPTELVFTGSSLTQSTSLWRFDRADGRLEQAIAPSGPPLSTTSHRHVCRSSDGRPVTFDVVVAAEHEDGAPAPTLVYAYGGFNVAWLTHGHPGVWSPWLAAGGRFVFAHLRGDGTFGAEQWNAGRGPGKRGTVADLLAVADDLVARGMTTPRQLAVAGGSNGGLVCAAALAQRPAAFGAAAVLVPLADMGRFAQAPFGGGLLEEYGDPTVAADAAWLRSYSPYHALAALEEPLPPTIVVCAERDMRTPVWHGRKLAAALQAADSDATVLLRTHRDRGHLTAGAGGDPAAVAEWLGFLMHHTGLAVAGEEAAGSGALSGVA